MEQNKNSEYLDKLAELIEKKGSVEEFKILYMEYKDKHPNEELVKQYENIIKGEFIVTASNEEDSEESYEEPSYNDDEDSYSYDEDSYDEEDF